MKPAPQPPSNPSDLGVATFVAFSSGIALGLLVVFLLLLIAIKFRSDRASNHAHSHNSNVELQLPTKVDKSSSSTQYDLCTTTTESGPLHLRETTLKKRCSSIASDNSCIQDPLKPDAVKTDLTPSADITDAPADKLLINKSANCDQTAVRAGKHAIKYIFHVTHNLNIKVTVFLSVRMFI